MKFSIKDFFCKFPADLVTFTEEVLNGKIQFLFSENFTDFVLSVALLQISKYCPMSGAGNPWKYQNFFYKH